MSNKPFSKILKRVQDMRKYLDKDARRIVGQEAVKHFKQSFQNEGFTDSSLEKWPEVKRRQASSAWYGFEYKSNSDRPGKKRRKPDSTTNFSPAATKRKILSGSSKKLHDSIQWEATAKGIKVYANADHAQIHNEGGEVNVFNKSIQRMPKRKFLGKSKVLSERVRTMILEDLKKFFK